MTSADLERLLEEILYRGISPRRRDLDRSNWSLGQSFLFTVTVVTTIGMDTMAQHTGKEIFVSGYGHIHPLTNTGKTACIVYAIIGIPFTLIFLSAIVQRLLAPTFKLLSSFIRMCPNMDTFRVKKNTIFYHFCFRETKQLTTYNSSSPLQVRLIHLALMGSMYLLLSILVPTILFWILEPDWSFLDGVYFVFISLTTIGLGDYIPGDNPAMAEYQVQNKRSNISLYFLMAVCVRNIVLGDLACLHWVEAAPIK